MNEFFTPKCNDSRENKVQKCPSDLYLVEKPVIKMNRIK